MTTNKIDVSNASLSARIDLIDQLLANIFSQGNSKMGVLLAGDPGIGKTSFAKFFAKLCGLTLITIEAPHITVEHVINIPFIVSDPLSDNKRTGEQEVAFDKSSKNQYHLVLADSHLYGELTSSVPVSDEKLLNWIQHGAPEDTQKVWEHLGGDEDTIPPQIAKVRAKYKTLLFLDEFFRQSNEAIRNMLRGILDGKIGMHELPKNVYVMYASNMQNTGGSEGIDGSSMHTVFNQIEFEAPNKEDWFAYLISKFKKTNVKLNMQIMEKFHQLLDDQDISHTDVDTEIRVSPRRWEQLLLYINAALPLGNLPGKDKEKEAKALMTNVRANFKDYASGQHAAIMQKVVNAVQELIQEIDGISIGTSGLRKTEWRDAMEHQIAMKMKLGDHRAYIPIMSGAPGIGKTFESQKIAEDLDLRYIYVNCANFDQDDINGIPVADRKDDGIRVKFAFPKLYRQIMDEIKKEDREHLAQLKKEGKDDEAAEYRSKEWKYLIFFDELNRTKTKVFNALRRVILEKNFGDDLALPKEAVVMAAINPVDSATAPLTSHMKDVVDVIDASPSWATVSSWLPALKHKGFIAPELEEKIYKVIVDFSENFKDRSNDEVPEDERNFYLEIGADVVYLSPREYVAMYEESCQLVNVKLERLLPKFHDADDQNEREQILAQINYEVRDSIFKKIRDVLRNVKHRHNTENPKFLQNLRGWIHDLDYLDFLTKEVESMSFSEVMDHYYGQDDKDLSSEIEFSNYIQHVDVHQFSEDLQSFLMNEIADEVGLDQFVLSHTHPLKTRDMDTGDVIEHLEKATSKVEHFARELVHAIKQLNMSKEYIDAVQGGVKGFFKAAVSRMRASGKMDNAKAQKLLSINTSLLSHISKIK